MILTLLHNHHHILDIMSQVQHIKVNYSDIISKQATINLGTIGHVSHGKTTTVAQITGERTQKYKKEITRNKTIHIGYANAKIWLCPETGQVISTPSHLTHKISPYCSQPMKLISHISFVDCPGDSKYICTMISGTSTMNAVLMLIGANDDIFPQEQTYKHLSIMKTTDVTNYVVLQNKLDLITKKEAVDNKNKIVKFLNDMGAPADMIPIVPISAQFGTNIDAVNKYIAYALAKPKQDPNKDFKMFIIRSYDLNKPKNNHRELMGGAVGGSIVQGCVMPDDYVEIRPGFVIKNGTDFTCYPLVCQIKTLFSDKEKLHIAFPGGLVSLGLDVDPSLTRVNKLVGNIVGTPGTLPKIYKTITFEYKSIKALKKNKMKPIEVGETINISVNAVNVSALVVSKEANKIITVDLSIPVCIDTKLRMAIVRYVKNEIDVSKVEFVIHSYAKFLSGKEVNQVSYPDEYQTIIDNIPERHVEIVDDIDMPTKNTSEYLNYDTLLDNIGFATEKQSHKFYLIDPIVQRQNKKSIITNYNQICSSFTKETKKKMSSQDVNTQKAIQSVDNEDNEIIDIANFLTGFIGKELKTGVSINETHQLILTRYYTGRDLVAVMKRFATEYSQCAVCKKFNTLIVKQKKDRLMFLMCLNCHSKVHISK